MCIWKCAIEDRHCEFCRYEGGCERRPKDSPKKEKRPADEYLEAIKVCSGLDVKEKTRKHQFVWGRNMVAYRMFQDGYRLKEIVSVLGLGRPGIIHCIRHMEQMLDMPSFYEEEMELYHKFLEKLRYVEENSEMVVVHV